MVLAGGEKRRGQLPEVGEVAPSVLASLGQLPRLAPGEHVVGGQACSGELSAGDGESGGGGETFECFGVVQVVVGELDRAGAVGVAAGAAGSPDREVLVEVDARHELADLVDGIDRVEAAPYVVTDYEPMQIPRRVFAECAQCSPWSVPVDQQFGVVDHDGRHFTESGWRRDRPSRKGFGQLTEQPGSAQAAAADHDAVAAGLIDHGQGVG